jgi:hypothetical protein
VEVILPVRTQWLPGGMSAPHFCHPERSEGSLSWEGPAKQFGLTNAYIEQNTSSSKSGSL